MAAGVAERGSGLLAEIDLGTNTGAFMACAGSAGLGTGDSGDLSDGSDDGM